MRGPHPGLWIPALKTACEKHMQSDMPQDTDGHQGVTVLEVWRVEDVDRGPVWLLLLWSRSSWAGRGTGQGKAVRQDMRDL